MSDPAAQRSRVQTEAAAWFARMSRRSVTTHDLRSFRDWKRDPANAAAYAAVETGWDAASLLVRDPQIAAATDAALRRRPPRAGPSSSFAWPRAALLGAGALAAAGAIAATVAFGTKPTFATQVGQQSVVTLADGSRVHLNTDSRLRVAFRADERRILLDRGEAFFEVAHDAARPFIVEADGARVRALGTKFDVRRDPAGVQVTLLEGRVRVARTDRGATAELSPNQQVTVSERAISPPRPADAAQVSEWTAGRITFHGTPLREAVAEVNRYTADKVVLDGPAALGDQPVSGAFNAGDTGAFVASVAAVFDLQSARAADGRVRLSPRTARPAG